MNSYKTIIKKSEALFKEKGSKFLAYAYPILAQEQIQHELEKLKQSHPKASHHCYAYKIGIETPEHRANDDGEPSNSAGKPILGQIESYELSNVLVVVVRYYGGTKLGVGGLQTAYKTAAKLAIEASEIIEKEIPVFFTIIFPFDRQGIVDHLITTLSGEIMDKQFDAACHYHCMIPKTNVQQFTEQLGAERSIEVIIEN